MTRSAEENQGTSGHPARTISDKLLYSIPGFQFSYRHFAMSDAEREDEPLEMDPVVELQAKLAALSDQHGQAMAQINALSSGANRSYVYLPRDRPVQPFSGDVLVDGRSIDEFIDEVQRAIRTRGLSDGDQVDFILSLLRGSALEEVKLCTDEQANGPGEIFNFLREAYGEKRSVAQLLQTFYSRYQLEGEDFFEYSHALSQILRSALKQKPSAVSDAKIAVRDQFIEGIQDSSLRRELRKTVREKPESTLLDVRQEAIAWSLEDRPNGPKVAKSRSVLCDRVGGRSQGAGGAPDKVPSTLDEILKVVTEQGKAIGELVNAVKESVTLRENAFRSARPRPRFQFTDEGRPICFKCKGVGHIARECRQNRPERSPTANDAHVPGN